MNTARSFIIALGLMLLVSSALAQPEDSWTKANQEYAAGHFRAAADLYQGLARAGETSAALFYNLGNTYYRLDDLGQAILNYERALALDPHQPEAESNLRLVRDKARALELQRNWFEREIARATPTRYVAGAAIGFWLAAFALTAMFFSPRRPASLLATVMLGLLLLAGAGYALYALETGANGGALAIVTGKKIEARLATADSAGAVLALPPGSEVKILSTRGDWSYATLPNDLRGWIPAQSAERVRW